MTFSGQEIREAIGGRALGEPPAAPMTIATDTRTLERGQAYLALHGEHFDGNDFARDAFVRGAALAIVEREDAVPPGRPAIVVDDALRAYHALAAIARARSAARVVAITGSTGKTTTKALLVQMLANAGVRVRGTPHNENNEIGVAKLLLSLSGEEDIVVVEMGCRHYGEIAELVAIARPHVGVLTNIGEAHLEIMGTRERLAET
ncbi:MAG: UDP-N-acetylmuramoyl-tripeptide--D-alanyl-D-alanine ligase, partial [Candidatus Eremiobacteraeota bacterium]|nr:UDP-N-acetylmuramoyl-tripeptide--D-alanyl-D-alanine ligase [Candidatus Eremiobacteraeota bacterium]